MVINGYNAGSKNKELALEYSDMKFTAYPARITSGEEIIGCYIDGLGTPHLVYRKSLFGGYIIEAFEDSRKYNPDAWVK
jgi:hypothetical protein